MVLRRGGTAHDKNMGHATATIHIAADHADRIRASLAGKGRSTWSYYRPTFENELLRAAVAIWRDEDAGRWDDAREGAATMTEMRTPHTKHRYPHDGGLVYDGASLIVPVCRDEDVIVKTVKKTVTVSGEALTRQRSKGYIEAEIRDAVEKVVGPSITKITIVKSPTLRKPRAIKAAGKTTTVFDVINHTDFSSQVFSSQVLATKATEAEAKAEAIRLMDANEKITEMKVQGRIVRVAEDGTAESNLTIVRRPVADTVSITVEVTTEAVKPGAKVAYYAVSFDYHH